MKAPSIAALAFALAAGLACRSGPEFQVSVEMPGVSAVPAGSFDQVVVTDFRDESPLPDHTVGRELRDYLATEIDVAFDGTVTRLAAPEEGLAGRRERVLVIAGSVSMTTEVRKALDKKNILIEGPFRTAGRGLIEVRRWTMTVDLSVLSAADGTTLCHRLFQEERDYTDVEKPLDFAFSELSARVRARLLPLLVGSSTIETRTLLGR